MWPDEAEAWVIRDTWHFEDGTLLGTRTWTWRGGPTSPASVLSLRWDEVGAAIVGVTPVNDFWTDLETEQPGFYFWCDMKMKLNNLFFFGVFLSDFSGRFPRD